MTKGAAASPGRLRDPAPSALGGPELIFFDVGDTLIRAEPSWADVYLGAARAHGMELDRSELARALRESTAAGAWAEEGPFEASAEASYGRVRAFDAAVLERLGQRNVPEDFFRSLERAFAAREAWHIFPDVLPALDAIAAAGIRRAVISNWLWGAPELLHQLELAARFESLVISARVGFQKPHVGIFEHALELTGVPADRTLHVGDSWAADVEGARRAGIRAVLLQRPGPDTARVPSGIAREGVPVVGDLLELIDLLGLERPSLAQA